MLIDAAVAWTEANCRDVQLRADLKRKLKDAMQRQSDCWFGLGPVLTKEHAPYLIHCFAGELFIFQLTDRQAAVILPAPNALASSIDQRPPGSNRCAGEVLVSLAELELDRPFLTSGEPVKGSVHYEVQGELPAEYCLRLDYQLGLADAVSWNRSEQILAGSGRIRFSFNRLADSIWPSVRDHRGPIALFLRVCTWPTLDESSPRRPISNTCGTLVDCIPESNGNQGTATLS